MNYNRKGFRKLISALTTPEFDRSLDDFPDVREQFTRGMSKADKEDITALLKLLVMKLNYWIFQQ